MLGTISISGAFAARRVLPDWWLLLLLGLAEVPLGVLALANPGATLAAIITVGGIWAVVVGAMRIVYAFELRRLPEDVDQAFADHRANGATGRSVRAVRLSFAGIVELTREAPRRLPSSFGRRRGAPVGMPISGWLTSRRAPGRVRTGARSLEGFGATTTPRAPGPIA